MPDPIIPHGDHLAALSMAGSERVSAGFYTPDRLDLTLTGGSQATDLLVYVHEAHHQALNDSTAWGGALHVLSALGPRQRACFTPLLDACRLAHEAYATFAAVSIVAVHHADTEAVLSEYPGYERLHRSLAALTAAAGGPHRAYLLATALARVSMQTPVLAAMLASADLTVAASDLPTIDTPDGRWVWLIRAGRELSDRAAGAADDHVARTLGTAGLGADVADRSAAAAVTAQLDRHWEMWERAAYAVLSEALSGAGATVLAFNGHMEPSREVVRRAREIDPALPLRAGRPHSPAQDDATLSGAMIQFVRLNLVETPRRARLDAATVHELARRFGSDSIETGVGNRAAAVLHIRLPRRMLESYRWPAADTAVLEAAEAPIVAVRLIEPGAGESTIAHVRLPEPDAVQDLTAARPEEPSLVTVSAASCFIDADWSADWLPALREAGPLVVLIDIEAARFVGSWVRDQRQIRASMIRVADTTGVYWATALLVGEDPAVWLQLGDELTVKLVLDQLRGTDGLLLDVSPDHIRDAAPLLTDVISHLLATESFLDLRGLDPDTIRRITARRAPVAEEASPRALADALNVVIGDWAHLSGRLPEDRRLAVRRQLAAAVHGGDWRPQEVLAMLLYGLPDHPAWATAGEPTEPAAMLTAEVQGAAMRLRWLIELDEQHRLTDVPKTWHEVAEGAAFEVALAPAKLAELRVSLVPARRVEGHIEGLLTLRSGAEVVAPIFQFDASGELLEAVADANRALAADEDAWGAASWWLSPHAALHAIPADAVRHGRAEDVVAAARAAAT